MDKPFLLNYAPLLINLPYQESKLIAAINQIEQNGKISFRVAGSIEDEGAGSFELEVKNKEQYKNGEPPIWGTWDEELNAMSNPLIDTLGKHIQTFFKKLI